jgi:hypothetical protein
MAIRVRDSSPRFFPHGLAALICSRKEKKWFFAGKNLPLSSPSENQTWLPSQRPHSKVMGPSEIIFDVTAKMCPG